MQVCYRFIFEIKFEDAVMLCKYKLLGPCANGEVLEEE
jgi:hypothetical protein